ncbi:MAG: DUF5654 family protein [bacterium]|nr:DUF5654 family protein [bacterium]
MAKKKIKEIKPRKGFLASITNEMLKLSTTGFGLVAALAWNDTVKMFIEEYIKPYTARGSELVSQVIYAIIVTLLAVTITYQLTVLKDKLANRNKLQSKS